MKILILIIIIDLCSCTIQYGVTLYNTEVQTTATTTGSVFHTTRTEGIYTDSSLERVMAKALKDNKTEVISIEYYINQIFWIFYQKEIVLRAK